MRYDFGVTAAAPLPRRPATVDDLARLPEGRAAEIIDGELIEKAQPTFEHGSAQSAIVGQLFGPYNRRHGGGGGPGGWWIATEVEVQYEEGQVYRHDIVGWRRESLAERPRGRFVRVRPDWVAEVLSPSNASNDLVKKLRTLGRHRVPHYWLVDPERRTLAVMRWTPEGYLTALAADETEIVRAEPFDAIDLHVATIFGVEDDA